MRLLGLSVVAVLALSGCGAEEPAAAGGSTSSASSEPTSKPTEATNKPKPAPKAEKWDTGDSGEASPVAAEAICKQAVEQQLTSPSTAKYDSDDTKTLGGAAHYLVRGAVHSQSASGGLVSGDYLCNLSYVGNDEWRVGALRVTPSG